MYSNPLNKFCDLINLGKEKIQILKDINEVKDQEEIILISEIGKFKMQDLNSFNFERNKLKNNFTRIVVLEN